MFFTSLQELQGCHCWVQGQALHFSLQSGQPTAPQGELHAQCPPLTFLDKYSDEDIVSITPGKLQQHRLLWKVIVSKLGKLGVTMFVDDFLDLFIKVLPTFDQGL